MDYPSNSKSAGANQPKREKRIQTPVIQGKVIPRKQPLGKRIASLLIAGDPKTSARESAMEVFLPGLQRIVLDTLKQSLDRLILGEAQTRSGGIVRTFGGQVTRVAYESAGKSISTQRQAPKPQLSWQARSTHNFDEILLEEREDAVNAIEKLRVTIEEYGVARVSDLYDAVDMTSEFTDDKWGWYDLSQAGLKWTSDGYLLNLPKPVPLS